MAINNGAFHVVCQLSVVLFQRRPVLVAISPVAQASTAAGAHYWPPSRLGRGTLLF